MIIDGHAHACGDFLKRDQLLKILAENGADRVALCPGELNSAKNYHLPNLAQKYPQKDFSATVNNIIKITVALTGKAGQIDAGNDYVYGLARQAPERISQFYWVDPGASEVVAKLDREYGRMGFAGLKLHQCWNRFDLRLGYMDDIAEWAGGKSLPVFIHLGSQRDAVAMAELIRRHPDTNFIIAHLIGLAVFADALRDRANAFFDTSGYQLIPEKKLLAAIDRFGAVRLVMGSDTPYGRDNLRHSIARIRGLKLPEREQELILGGNMQSLLHL